MKTCDHNCICHRPCDGRDDFATIRRKLTVCRLKKPQKIQEPKLQRSHSWKDATGAKRPHLQKGNTCKEATPAKKSQLQTSFSESAVAPRSIYPLPQIIVFSCGRSHRIECINHRYSKGLAPMVCKGFGQAISLHSRVYVLLRLCLWNACAWGTTPRAVRHWVYRLDHLPK